jgi:hemerythrin-like domain-containing protein
MNDIQQHIDKDRKLIEDSTISPQMRRHTEEELQALEKYQQRHPEDSYDPTPLELYCDSHPDALECRVYDD